MNKKIVIPVVIFAFIIGVVVGFIGSSFLPDLKNLTSSEPIFDNYGIFVQTKDKPIKIKGFQFSGINDYFLESSVNNTITIDKSDSGSVKIWAYTANKGGDYILLTDLKTKRGVWVCCFNCGSYSRNPSRVCKPLEFNEKPVKKENLREFKINLKPDVYCFMNKENRMGYIFRIR